MHNVPFLAQNVPSKMCQFWDLNLPGCVHEVGTPYMVILDVAIAGMPKNI